MKAALINTSSSVYAYNLVLAIIVKWQGELNKQGNLAKKYVQILVENKQILPQDISFATSILLHSQSGLKRDKNLETQSILP